MQQRLQLLLDQGVIDREVYVFCLAAAERLEAAGFSGEEMEAFITHLAVSAMRIKQGAPVHCDAAGMQSELLDDVGQAVFEEALALWRDIEAQGAFRYGDEERIYVLLHLCTMLSNHTTEQTTEE